MQQEKKDRRNRKRSSKFIDRTTHFKSESRDRRSIDQRGANNTSMVEPNQNETKATSKKEQKIMQSKLLESSRFTDEEFRNLDPTNSNINGED